MAEAAAPRCIMGVAANYVPDDVAVFLTSLARTGYAGRLVLFVLGRLATEPLPATPFSIERVPVRVPDRLQGMSWSALRNFLYHDYLRTRGKAFTDILLTDTRDVLFQRDPFDFPLPGELLVTLEGTAAQTIGSCRMNSLWVLNRYGPREFERVRQARISCAGTIRGTRQGLLAYLRTMCAWLYPYVPGPYMEGYDQGAHNIVVHNRLVDGIVSLDNAGPILTLHFVDEADLRFDAAGRICNSAGEAAHVVHQYDRKPRLAALVRERYGPPGIFAAPAVLGDQHG